MIMCLWVSYKKKYRIIFFFFLAFKVTKERSRIRIRSWIRSGSISQRYGSADADPDPP